MKNPLPYLRKHYDLVAGDEISWTNTEEDMIGLIKTELPYKSVEIKKRELKGLKW